MMALGFTVLRLSPAAFWAMTPRELAAAMGAATPADDARLGRDGLAALMMRFPDKPRGWTR